LKVNQEIEKLKDRFFARQTCGNTAVSHIHCDIARLNNASQGTTEATTNTSHSASEQGSGHLRSVYDTNVNVSPRLLVNNSTLNELALPIYSDNATQIIGNFLKELDIYFDLKSISENLRLPLAPQAIKDPFAKGWLNAEYHKLGTYEEFKVKITQLLWNDQLQANTRCTIFCDKYMRNGGESLAEHYLKYMNLAVSLQPPVGEYDLLGALTAHYALDIQKCVISANLKSNRDALMFFGKLQVLKEEGKSYIEDRQEPST
jgi:hypothetical protein